MLKLGGDDTHCTQLVTVGAGRKHRTAILRLGAEVLVDRPRARGDEVSNQESQAEPRNSAVYRMRGDGQPPKLTEAQLFLKEKRAAPAPRTATANPTRRGQSRGLVRRGSMQYYDQYQMFSSAVNRDTKYLSDQLDRDILLPLPEPAG